MRTKPSTRPDGPEDETLALFRKDLPRQALMGQVADLLGNPFDRALLSLGGDAAVAYHLRRLGGTWVSADLGEAPVAVLRRLVGDGVHALQGPDLPFEEAAFDVVVISDLLERMDDDRRLIAECHRVLKPMGRLIVNVPNLKRGALLRPARRLLDRTDQRDVRVRPGYTESQLFDLLKDGFDFELARTYNRFFVEATRLIVQQIAPAPAPGGEARLLRRRAVAYPFFRLAVLLDGLLPFLRGYHLIARARRRPWRPRRAPILSDGRSIAEAALGSRIGTAAPF